MSLKQNKRKYLHLILLLAYVGLVGILGIWFQKADEITYDVIQMNRIIKTAEEYWKDIIRIDNLQFEYPFALLDSGNHLICQSGPKAVTSIAEAMKYGDGIFPVTAGESTGNVIITIHLERNRQLSQIAKKNSILICVVLVAGLVILLIYRSYLNHQVLEPFLRITDFTREIAYGNLDIPLSEQGSKVFRPFVQSFELMRDELKTAKQREFEANQSKKELVAELSHDIKTPVTSIRLTTELLMVMVQEDSMKQRLEAILSKTEQIDHLITDLFHTTMEDLEALSVNPSEAYSSQLVKLIHDADCNNCVTMLSIPECMIIMDPLRMGQILANIIYNSYKYANTEINITGKIEGPFLELFIQDFGDGVDEEELPLLFNRFYRGKNAGSHTGSGLGLYICKKLLEQMSGDIYCSNNDKGFLTLLQIPLAK